MGCIVFFPCDPIAQLDVDSLIISLTSTEDHTKEHLQLIGNISASEESCLKRALSQWPHGGIQSEYTNELQSTDNTEKCYSVTFKGNPWLPGNLNEGIHALVTLMTLVNQLKELGWSLLISTDVSANQYTKSEGEGSRDYPLDCHSLFLMRTRSQ